MKKLSRCRLTRLKILCLIPAMVFFSLNAIGQNKIEGTVFDFASNETLVGAHVIIKNTYKKTITDINGKFTFSSIKPGNYSLTVSYLGYKTKEITMEIKEKYLLLNIAMERDALLQDEVIIKATRAGEKTATPYTELNKKEISQINLAQDMPYIMSLTPSTVVTSDAGTGVGYTGIRIRGTDMNRINITVNGIPLNDPESHGVWWVDLPDMASSVDNIQVQRGVGTSSNGAGAFGASINVQSKKLNPDKYAEIRNSYGSFSTRKHTVSMGTGLVGGHWSFDARLSQLYSDGYIDRASADLKSFYTSAAYYDKKNLVKAIIFSGKEKTYLSWEGVPSYILDSNRTYNPFTYENETDNYQQDHYQLHFSRELNSKLFLNVALHYTKGFGYYEQFKEDVKFSKYGLSPVLVGSDTIERTDLIRRKYLDNDFYGITGSANYKKDRADIIFGGSFNTYEGGHYGTVIWSEYASNYDINYKWYENKGDKTDGNLFLKTTYQLTSRLNIYGDLQYRIIDYSIEGINDDMRDITQKHSFSFFNPKAGLFYQFNEQHSAYFSCAVGNREPNRDNFVGAPANRIPQSEQLIDYEAGYTFLNTKGFVNVNFYYMDYNNQLVLTGEINDVGDAIMVNVPKSYRAGLELSAAFKIKNIDWQGNITLSRNKILDFVEYVDDWDTREQRTAALGTTDLSFSPEITGASKITWSFAKGLKLSLLSKYVGKQYLDNTSSEDRKLDPWFVNNILLEYTISKWKLKELSFEVLANNIFDTQYESNAWIYRYYEGGQHKVMDGYYPQAGRNFLVGLTLKF